MTDIMDHKGVSQGDGHILPDGVLDLKLRSRPGTFEHTQMHGTLFPLQYQSLLQATTSSGVLQRPLILQTSDSQRLMTPASVQSGYVAVPTRPLALQHPRTMVLDFPSPYMTMPFLTAQALAPNGPQLLPVNSTLPGQAVWFAGPSPQQQLLPDHPSTINTSLTTSQTYPLFKQMAESNDESTTNIETNNNRSRTRVTINQVADVEDHFLKALRSVNKDSFHTKDESIRILESVDQHFQKSLAGFTPENTEGQAPRPSSSTGNVKKHSPHSTSDKIMQQFAHNSLQTSSSAFNAVTNLRHKSSSSDRPIGSSPPKKRIRQTSERTASSSSITRATRLHSSSPVFQTRGVLMSTSSSSCSPPSMCGDGERPSISPSPSDGSAGEQSSRCSFKPKRAWMSQFKENTPIPTVPLEETHNTTDDVFTDAESSCEKKQKLHHHGQSDTATPDSIQQQKMDITSDNPSEISLEDIKSFTSPLLQYTDCNSITAPFTKCISCTQPNADSKENCKQSSRCRFKNFRKFIYRPEKEQYEIIFTNSTDEAVHNTSWWLADKLKDASPKGHEVAKITIEKMGSLLQRIIADDKKCSGFAFPDVLDDSILLRELPRDALSIVCDVCHKTIFNRHWICAQCGSEMCSICIGKVEQAGKYSSPSRWSECPVSERPHGLDQALPTLLIPPGTLRQVEERLQVATQVFPGPSSIGVNDVVRLVRLPQIEVDSLQAFQGNFRLGGPVVIANCLSEQSRMIWTPECLRQLNDLEELQITDGIKVVMANDQNDFWEGMSPQSNGEANNATDGYRLSTTLPGRSLEKHFPLKYQAAVNSFPIPDYTSSTGAQNLLSRLPNDHMTETSDLDLHLYAGHAHATQPLRFAATDLVSTLVYQGGDENQDGVLWHIFHARDVKRIEHFLEQRHLHGYLTPELLLTLSEKEGVVPRRVIQRFGEAVLVPAGSHYQITNLQPSIQIYKAFLSMESVTRVYQTTQCLKHIVQAFPHISCAMEHLVFSPVRQSLDAFAN